MKRRLHNWASKQMPRREELAENRWVGSLARRSELWRFTRRSVPRGVAIGLLVGIFALIPGVQMVGAALLCVPCRGNIPVAAGMTFLSNPATTPFILLGSVWIGNALGFSADVEAFLTLYRESASVGEWLAWLLSDAAPAVVLGLFVISVVAAAIGYLITSFAWRVIVARKRRNRINRSQALSPAE